MSKLLFLMGCAVCICAQTPNSAAESGMDTNSVAPEAIARDLGAKRLKAAHLLAFSSQIDDRPLCVDRALIAIEFNNKRWQLVYVFRHPKDSKVENRGWCPAFVNDVPVAPSKGFKKKPTEDEVDQFLLRSDWKFQASEGFRLLRGEVFTNTWQRVLGYTPKYAFPKPSV